MKQGEKDPLLKVLLLEKQNKIASMLFFVKTTFGYLNEHFDDAERHDLPSDLDRKRPCRERRKAIEKGRSCQTANLGPIL